MADERIDVVVTDKVDAGVAKKLDQIADAAERGQTHLDRLKAALSNVNSSALDRLAAAMAKADSAQAKLLNAQARLTSAQNQGSVAAQKVALAQQKVATEAARTATAQANAEAATTRAASAAATLAAAQQRAQGASAAAANATQQSAAAAGQAGAAYNSAAASATRFAGAQGAAAAASGQAAAASQRVGAGLGNVTGAHNQYARAARQTNAANANIIAQMQDIGVSLAGGQNPLLVLIQQGSQLSYIASTMEGGWTKIIGVMGRLLLKFAPLIAAFGALWLAMDRIREQADVGMEDYVKSLGLTDKEVKRLTDTHVTMGDTIKAVWQEVSKDILEATGVTTDQVRSMWDTAVDWIIRIMRVWAVGMYTLVATLVQAIASKVMNIGKMFYNAGLAAKNLFLISIEALVNKTIDGINRIGGAVNWLSSAAGFGQVVGVLDHIDLGVGRVTDGMMAMDDFNPLQAFIDNAQDANNYLKGLGDRVGATARQIAEARLAAQARDIIGDRTPRAARAGPEDNTAENRARALAQVNLQLDNELARMRMLKDERAIQQRMDQIEQSLAQKRITLNDDERRSILAKVTAIEEYKYTQQELDRIYEETTGPLRTFNATLDAANQLFNDGRITLEQYQAQLVRAQDTFNQANDPLYQFNEQIRLGSELIGKYGVELERAIYLQSIDQEYRSRGLSIYDASTGKLRAEVAALVAKNDALRQQQYIQSQAASFIDPAMEQNRFLQNYQTIYAEIDRMRQADLENEAVYQQALYALQARYNEMRLGGVSDFFGALAQVTSKGHGAIGAISKAAAVAQATIDGYVAVQKALASLPPPWNFAAAAAVAIKTGAQVAGILSTNVGGFATGGQFMVEGKSGVDANNINMDVTRGERVTVETPAQQRANDNATNTSTPVINLKNVNVLDPREALAALNSSEGDTVMLNFIERNTPAVRQLLGSN